MDGPNDTLLAYALNMEDDHHYQYGNWLLEQDMPKGFRGVLRGLTPAPTTAASSLDAKASPPLKIPAPPDPNDASIFGQIKVPRPRKIHYLHPGTVKIKNAKQLIDPISKVCGLTVFELCREGRSF